MKWTYSEVKKEAKKYQTRSMFYHHCGSAYHAALRNGWLDDVCNHMKQIYKPKGYWTYERVKKEAKKYKTRGAFCTHSKSAYSAAYRGEYLDDVCRHMKYCYVYG